MNHIKDLTELDDKRRKLKKEAKYIADASRELQEKERRAEEELVRAEKLATDYQRLIEKQKKTMADLEKDPRVTRKIQFGSPDEAVVPPIPVVVTHEPYVDRAGNTVMPTPKENLAMAVKTLQERKDDAGVEQALKFCAKALEQQEKVETSRKLASDSKDCLSSAGHGGKTRPPAQVHSHVGSSEKRRLGRDADRPIQIHSDPKGRRSRSPHKHDRRRDVPNITRPDMPPPKNRGVVIYDQGQQRRDDGNRDDAGKRNHEDNRHSHGGRSHEKSKGASEHRGDSKRSDRSRSRSKSVSKKDEPPHGDPGSPPSSKHGGGGFRKRTPSPDRGSNGGKRDPSDARNRVDALRNNMYVGPPCFGQRIRDEVPPKTFKISGQLKTYDGTSEPQTWLDDFFNAIKFATGTPNTAVQYLPLVLVGTARQWLQDLPERSINCWSDLQEVFKKNFLGTYQRAGTPGDLQRCIQRPDETCREYLARWIRLKNSCEGVTDEMAVISFVGGLEKGTLLRYELTRLKDQGRLSFNEMISIASGHAAASDDANMKMPANAYGGVKQKNKRKNQTEEEKPSDGMVAMAFQGRGNGGQRGRGRGGGAGRGQQRKDESQTSAPKAQMTYEEFRDLPCMIHVDANGKSSHTNRTCKFVNDLKADPEAGYKRARRNRPRGKGKAEKAKESEDASDMDEDEPKPSEKSDDAGKSKNPFQQKKAVFHTFLATPSVKAQKSAMRALNATVPKVPQYVKWSENPITWDRQDHPDVIPRGFLALVVNPMIDGYEFTKCLMDGGSSLNIMYIATLEKLGLTTTQLNHSSTIFYGVVPGRKAASLGSIKLPVVFGDEDNYREESVTFEVVPFKSVYHVIFGRPAYHTFHARPCYIYNKLKMPGPKGTITITCNPKKAQQCELGEAAFAEEVLYSEELQGMRDKVDKTEMPALKRQLQETTPTFKAADETKQVELVAGDSAKTTSVGAQLDPK